MNLKNEGWVLLPVLYFISKFTAKPYKFHERKGDKSMAKTKKMIKREVVVGDWIKENMLFS